MKERTLVFAYARMNPPTIGHQRLIEAMVHQMRANKAAGMLVLSHKEDKKNPLDVETKLSLVEKMCPPNLAVYASGEHLPSFMEWVVMMNKQKWTNLIYVCGSDRIDNLTERLNTYNGKLYKYKSIKVVSAGVRDPDGNELSSISGTKMRQYAAENDAFNFRRGLPNVLLPQAKEIMEACNG